MTKKKVLQEFLNYDLYKSQSEIYGKALRNMARTIIRNIPREMLIDILKKMKIIEWNYKRSDKVDKYKLRKEEVRK